MTLDLFLLKSLIPSFVTFYSWVCGSLCFLGSLLNNLWKKWKSQITMYQFSIVELTVMMLALRFKTTWCSNLGIHPQEPGNQVETFKTEVSCYEILLAVKHALVLWEPFMKDIGKKRVLVLWQLEITDLQKNVWNATKENVFLSV